MAALKLLGFDVTQPEIRSEDLPRVPHVVLDVPRLVKSV